MNVSTTASVIKYTCVILMHELTPCLPVYLSQLANISKLAWKYKIYIKPRYLMFVYCGFYVTFTFRMSTLFLPLTWTNESLWPPPPEPMRPGSPLSLSDWGQTLCTRHFSLERPVWNVEAGGCWCSVFVRSVKVWEWGCWWLFASIVISARSIPEAITSSSSSHSGDLWWQPLSASWCSWWLWGQVDKDLQTFTFTKRCLRGRCCQPPVSANEECHSWSDK